MPLTLTYAQHLKTIIEDNVLKSLSKNNGTVLLRSNIKTLLNITTEAIPLIPKVAFDNVRLYTLFIASHPKYYEENSAENSITISTQGENASLFLHIKISTEKQKNNTLTKKIILNANATTTTVLLEIDVGENQNINIHFEQIKQAKKEVSLFLHTIINFSKNSHVTLSNNFITAKEANTNTHTQWVYARTTSKLTGSSSTYQEHTTVSAKNKSYYDLKTTAELHAPHTTAILNMKGVIHDAGRCITQSNIIIGKEAEYSIGKEKSEILLIDEESKAEAIPQLMVHNDNTTCTHAGSISSVNREKVFYLQSKGIPEEQAKELIIEGFLANNETI